MRTDEVYRKTKETEVTAKVNLDGEGKIEVETGVAFFDHLLTSFATHSLIDVTAKVKGDLKHHSIEDLAIGLGEALSKALGNARRHYTLRLCNRSHGRLARIRSRRPSQATIRSHRLEAQRQKSRRHGNRRHRPLLRNLSHLARARTFTFGPSTAATTTTKQKPPSKPSRSA